jgi:long-subunit fatty acid transport protein
MSSLKYLVFALFVPSVAHAAAGSAFAETSQSAAMADAVTARPGNAGTLMTNPAGLADLKEAQIVLGAHADFVSQWIQRTGDPASVDRSRGFGGGSFAAATPLPGPNWLRHFGFGVALDVPAQYLLHLHIPTRVDEPSSPIYDGRPDKISAAFALGYKIIPGLELGVGFAISPTLTLPTLVQYQAGRSPNVNDNVEVRIDSSLDLAVVPFLGLRAQPTEWLGLALVYRDAQVSRATGTQTTAAGGILAPDSIDFFQMWEPSTVVVGASLTPIKRLTLTLDVTWRNWSAFRTAFDRGSDPNDPNDVGSPILPPYRFNDTLSIASGIEAKVAKGIFVRGGVGFEPTPIPAQTGQTNYLGANTIIGALGMGLDFRELKGLPFIVDAHVRTRIDAPQSATKNVATMPDADPTTAGTQIDNMGFPGFRSQAFMFQGGVTATFFIGGVK